MKILFAGKEWYGSDARTLALGFRQLGHLVHLIDDDRFFPDVDTLPMKVLRRLLIPAWVGAYNREVIAHFEMMKPDLFVVFKGTWLHPSTLEYIRAQGCPCILYYPDVSVIRYGKYIKNSVAHYDHIFTTKKLMIDTLKVDFNYTSVSFCPHSADSELHRKMSFNESINKVFGCDVTFIGQYTPKKEAILSQLVQIIPNLNIKIWGPNWHKNRSDNLKNVIQYQAPHGDLYVAAINYAKIVLSILFEGTGDNNGDTSTARTFQIPSCGAFMLHERTDELYDYFTEGEDVVSFASVAEMAEKIQYYLAHEEERKKIAENGYQTVHGKHMSHHRAQWILQECHKRNLL